MLGRKVNFSFMFGVIFQVLGFSAILFYGVNIAGIAIILVGSFIVLITTLEIKKITSAYVAASTFGGLMALLFMAFTDISSFTIMLLILNYALCFFTLARSDFTTVPPALPETIKEKIGDFEDAEKVLKRLEKEVKKSSKVKKSKAKKSSKNR